jgi:PQQ-dependent dehydrogenase (methanol/ethanol family)
MKIIRLGLALVLATALAACQKTAAPGAVDAKRLTAAAGNAEWLSYGKDYNEQRFSPLDKVNTGNVGQLGLSWYAQFDTDRGQEATPLMVDGVIYTSTAWSKVFAFDARTGKELWKFDPQVQGPKGFDACCDVVNRGVAVWKGKVFVGALDGRLIALDAKTGKPVWTVQTTDPAKPYTITGAPRVIKDKVLIGNGGAEYGVRGYITAYDAASGKQVWRFYMTPNPNGQPDGAASDKVMAEKGSATWSDGEWKKTGGGGTAWDAIAYDPQLDMVYIGVGNGSPWNHMRRSGGKGDNLFLSSILALRPDTGEYVWHYQTTPGESWDYTATQQITLADLTINGEPRKVLMQAPKNGFFYVVDRTNGQLISAKNYYPGINWATGVDLKTGRPIETPGARYQKAAYTQVPGPLGAHNWQPMAFDPKTGLVYIPTNVTPFSYGDQKDFAYKAGAWNVGVNFLSNALPTDQATLKAIMAMVKGQLVAWDPVQQKAVWTVDHPYFWNAGVLATAGGLVFQGSAEGDLAAYDAKSGQKLWSYKTGNGIIAAPMTYELDGEQYIAVMVGTGGGGQISAPASMPTRTRLPGRLLVFKLGGKAQAPAFPVAPQPPRDVTGLKSDGDVTHGFALFHENCQVCHGPNASGAWLPDLKRTPMLQTADNWKGVVIDGASASRGMASFARFLTPKDAEDIRAYVISEAKNAAAAQASPSPQGGAKAAAPIG